MTYLTKYAAVNNVLDFLLEHIRVLLAEKVCGIYLYGSLVSGDFDENISDIDLMVAINDPLTNHELETLKQMHENCANQFLNWYDRIEVAYITTEGLRTFRDKASLIAIISPGEPFHTKTAGLDWLINWYQIRGQSKVLFGPEPSSIIEPISKEEYVKAVSDQLREWEQWVETSHTKGFQAYAILTMCRGMYAIRFGKQVSKLKAASWAEEQYPEWAELIQTAIKWRSNQLKDGQTEDSEAHLVTVKFVRHIVEDIT